jgi:hypothetical protein
MAAENCMHQVQFFTALNTETSLPLNIDSPLIPFKTIPNHSWEVSKAAVMIEKQSSQLLLSVGLLNYGRRRLHASRPILNSPRPSSTQKPACFMT